MDARTRLAFFILKTRAGWIIRADGFVYPPCADQADALAKAIREALAAERLGFASFVLAQSAPGERCHIRWSCVGDAEAPSTAIADGGHAAIGIPAGGPSITAPLQSIEGQHPYGADALRERVRWVDAERRWHPVTQEAPLHSPPPAYPPPGHASLLRGAMLTRLTMACASVGPTTIKER